MTRSDKRLLRWGTGVAVALMLGAAFASPARANADDNSYLTDLTHAGIVINNPTIAVADGLRVCVESSQGWTWNQAALQLMKDNPALDYLSALAEAHVAAKDLC